MQKRVAASVALFENALAFASAAGKQRLVGSALFNLACAYAETDRLPQASEALKRAVQIDPAYKGKARDDDSFRKVRHAPALKWLDD